MLKLLSLPAVAFAFSLAVTFQASAADEAGGNNWERFKEGAKQAGGAAWDGTKNVAGKTGHAVGTGARKTGEFFAEGYEEVKDYVQEKTSDNSGTMTVIEPAPVVVEPIPEQSVAPLPQDALP